jgi:flagellar protein FliO/FliZ
MDTALLGLRVVLSLACVLGLIWFAGRKMQGSAGVRKQRTVPLTVLGRQSLGKGAGVALVEVAGRVLLLGVGEQGVSVLTEVDVPATPDETPRPERGGQVREEIDLATLPVVTAEESDDVATSDVDHHVGATPAAEADLAAELDPRADVPAPHAEGTARLAALAGLAAAGASATHAGAAQTDVPRNAEADTPTDTDTDPKADLPVDAQPCTATTGALHGSILSPDTWRRAVDVVQRRTSR